MKKKENKLTICFLFYAFETIDTCCMFFEIKWLNIAQKENKQKRKKMINCFVQEVKVKKNDNF